MSDAAGRAFEEPRFDERAFFAAHRAVPVPAYPDADPQDAVAIQRARSAPRHRARRRGWNPPVVAPELQPLHAQHAHDGGSLIR